MSVSHDSERSWYREVKVWILRRGQKNGSGKQSLRVLLLGPSLSAVSGVAEHLRQLGAAPFRDIEFRHFRVGSEGRREGRLQRVLRIFWSPWALVFRILRDRPAIVHLNTSLNDKAFWRDFVYMVLAKTLGRKVVFQVHGGATQHFLATSLKFARSRIISAFSLPDAVVVLSEKERRALIESSHGGTRPVVIRNAVDIETFGRQSGKSHAGPVLHVVYIGRLHKDKGVMDLAKAVSMVAERGRLVMRLEIAGHGPEEGALRTWIEERGMADVIELVGAVQGKAKIDFWNRADLFVLPSYHEGLPYAVLESLASATPMIVTNVGAIPEIIEENVHAVFVLPGEPEGLANALEALGFDRPLLRDMSGRCLERAREMFSIQRFTDEFGDLYRKISR